MLSLTHSITHSFTYSFTHLLIHSFTHSLSHSFILHSSKFNFVMYLDNTKLSINDVTNKISYAQELLNIVMKI